MPRGVRRERRGQPAGQRRIGGVVAVLGGLLAGLGAVPSPAHGDESPPADSSKIERRALAFLVREVPRWSRENGCYSCHNNGDAARALFAARTRQLVVPQEALRDTIAFLSRPDGWDKNGVDAEFSDKRLARLQFANALAAAVELGVVKDRAPLQQAAQRLVEDQSADGAWRLDEVALVGSPATYGAPLATALARRALITADGRRYGDPIARSGRWLLGRPVETTLDVAAILIGLDPTEVPDVVRTRCLELLRKGEGPTGGWGPFVNSPPETFDTAIALLALSRWPDAKAVAPLLRRGREYLMSNQSRDGSWTETTRPSGGESYAQRLSTSGWATLALLATGRTE